MRPKTANYTNRNDDSHFKSRTINLITAQLFGTLDLNPFAQINSP